MEACGAAAVLPLTPRGYLAKPPSEGQRLLTDGSVFCLRITLRYSKRFPLLEMRVGRHSHLAADSIPSQPTTTDGALVHQALY